MNLYTHMADMLVRMDQRRREGDLRLEARLEASRWRRRRQHGRSSGKLGRPRPSQPPPGSAEVLKL